MTKNSQLRRVADDLETTLSTYFIDKAPALPPSVKELIVEWLYILVLIGVVLTAWSLLVALGGLFGLGMYLPLSMGMMAFAPTTWFFLLVNLVGLAVGLVFQIKALPFIKKRRLEGWRWLYWSILVSVTFGVLSFNLIGALLGGLIGLYFLFQIKEYFK